MALNIMRHSIFSNSERKVKESCGNFLSPSFLCLSYIQKEKRKLQQLSSFLLPFILLLSFFKNSPPALMKPIFVCRKKKIISY